MNLRLLLASAALVLGACEQSPRAYPLPAQDPLFIGFKLHGVRTLNMEDADAPVYFVRDIQPDLHINWRWTMQHPEVRIQVRRVEGVKFTIDLAVPEVTFKDTGPVTIGFTVNDHVLDRVVYDHPGIFHFEKAVPASWLTLQKDAIIGADIDKMWTSPDDGAKFGFIIRRIGLDQ